MFRSSLLFTSICLVLCVCGGIYAIDQFGTMPGAPINPNIGQEGPGRPPAPGLAPRPRDNQPQQANEAVNAANQEIIAALTTLSTTLNQGKDPNVIQMGATLQKNSAVLQKVDAKGQVNSQVLMAWMQCFLGDFKKAKLAANAAYRADPQNKDAEISYIVMAIATNDMKNAKTAIKKATKPAAKPAAGRQQNAPPVAEVAQSPALLSFDVNSIKLDLLDKNIGAFDAMCLNGTSLSFKGGKTLFMLLWENARSSTPSSEQAPASAPMMPGMGGMPGPMGMSMGTQPGQTLSPLEMYTSSFASGFHNEKIAFLGVNLDAEEQTGAVMGTLMKNAWPWPQAMASDPRNTALASLVSLRSDKPSLVIVGADGTVKYAGAVSGVMLKVMAAQSENAPQTQLAPVAAAETSKKAEDLNAPQAQIAETAAAQPKEANAPAVAAAQQQAAAPKPKVKSSEETFNPAAIDAYQFAVSQKKMAHITGYGPMVKACRQILQQYPETPEAEKARQLLREMPESKRQQFHITNEEMGQ
jgi:hypothetical protein